MNMLSYCQRPQRNLQNSRFSDCSRVDPAPPAGKRAALATFGVLVGLGAT